MRKKVTTDAADAADETKVKPGLIVAAEALAGACRLSALKVSYMMAGGEKATTMRYLAMGWGHLAHWERCISALAAIPHGARLRLDPVRRAPDLAELDIDVDTHQVLASLLPANVILTQPDPEDVMRQFVSTRKMRQSSAETPSVQKLADRVTQTLLAPFPFTKKTVTVAAFNDVITALTDLKPALKAYHLPLVAGVTLNYADAVFRGKTSDALTRMHRLLSLLGCQLVLAFDGHDIILAPLDVDMAAINKQLHKAVQQRRTYLKKVVRDESYRHPGKGDITNRSKMPIADIIQLLKDGVSQINVALKANISPQRVSAIAKGAGIAARDTKTRTSMASGIKVLRKNAAKLIGR